MSGSGTVAPVFCFKILVEVVKNNGYPKCPALLFCANKNPSPEQWKKCQSDFASIMNARLVDYDCGHYIHHYKSAEMCEEVVKFVRSLEK